MLTKVDFYLVDFIEKIWYNNKLDKQIIYMEFMGGTASAKDRCDSQKRNIIHCRLYADIQCSYGACLSSSRILELQSRAREFARICCGCSQFFPDGIYGSESGFARRKGRKEKS